MQDPGLLEGFNLEPRGARRQIAELERWSVVLGRGKQHRLSIQRLDTTRLALRHPEAVGISHTEDGRRTALHGCFDYQCAVLPIGVAAVALVPLLYGVGLPESALSLVGLKRPGRVHRFRLDKLDVILEGET